MKYKTVLFAAVSCVVFAVVGMIVPGCESATGYDFNISPTLSYVYDVGAQITLTASSVGHVNTKPHNDFVWSLSHPAQEVTHNADPLLPTAILHNEYGFLSSSSGHKVVYTVTKIPENDDFLQTVYVTTRNVEKTNYDFTAAAKIIHKAYAQ